MSVTTAWQTVNDGEITSLDLSGVPSLDWVKIRWRGKRYKDTQTISQDYTLTDQDGVNEIKHDPPPEVPLGRNFEKYYISSQMTFNDGQPHHYVLSQYDMDIGHIIDRVRSLEDGEESSITLTNFYYEETSEIWTDGNNNTGHLYELYSLVRLYHYEYLQSENIRSTVDGYTTNGPTLLNNDEISDWETLSGITAGTNNNITHNIDSSETVEYQIEYQPSIPPEPTVHTDEIVYDRYQEEFDFTLDEHIDISGPYHAKVTIEGTEYYSKDDTTNWQYWDGSAWQDFPAAGVSVNTKVRYTYTNTWGLGDYAWSCRSVAEIDGIWTDGQLAENTLSITRLPAPTPTDPTSGERVDNRKAWFYLTVTSETYDEASNYEAKLQLSQFVSMDPIYEEFNSAASTGEWQYYDGAAWQNWPAGGVPPGTDIRVRPDNNLDYSAYYWQAWTYDGLDWSQDFYPRKVFIVISIDVNYSLFIDTVAYNVYTLQVSETANGSIGTIQFEIDNADGTNYDEISYGAIIELVVIDDIGNEEDYKGILREKNPQGKYMTCEAITGDGILSERLIKENYTSQDIGLTVKDIIDTYCSPLTSNNVDTGIGYSREIDANNKRPIKIFEELRKDYGIYYFVDAEWDLHFYKRSAVTAGNVTIRYGD